MDLLITQIAEEIQSLQIQYERNKEHLVMVTALLASFILAQGEALNLPNEDINDLYDAAMEGKLNIGYGGKTLDVFVVSGAGAKKFRDRAQLNELGKCKKV